jgi:hypothetical protein
MCDTGPTVISPGKDGSLIDLAGPWLSVLGDQSFAISPLRSLGGRDAGCAVGPSGAHTFVRALHRRSGNGRRVNLSASVLSSWLGDHGLEIVTRASTLRMVNFEQCSGRGFRTLLDSVSYEARLSWDILFSRPASLAATLSLSRSLCSWRADWRSAMMVSKSSALWSARACSQSSRILSSSRLVGILAPA